MKTLIKNFLLNSVGYPKPSSLISLISKDFREDKIVNDILDYFVLADGVYCKNDKEEKVDNSIVNQWAVNPVICTTIANAATHIGTGIMYLPNSDRYIMETTSGWSKYYTYALKTYKGIHKRINTSLPVFIFSGWGFHGIVDDLSSLIALWNKGYRFFVVIDKNNYWMNSLIDIFVPDLKKNLIYVSQNSWILCPKTISVTKSGMGEYTNPQLINLLNKHSKKIYFNREKYDKIFISRSDTNRRSYPGEENIKQQYIEKGYEELTLSKMPVESQISAFQSASYVTGLHGAGFTNIVWGKKKINVKEYILKVHHNSAIPVLCNYLGYSYKYQSCS